MTDTTQIQKYKVLANEHPRSLKEILLETGIVADEFNADRLLKSGAVGVGRVSAHVGMTVTCREGEPLQIFVNDDRYWVYPVSQSELLDVNDPNARFSENELRPY